MASDVDAIRAIVASASVIESALVELHADLADEHDGGDDDVDAVEGGARGVRSDQTRCWATLLDESSLLAIHRALLGVVEVAVQFAQDLEADRIAHPLAPVAARLLAVWLAQPSARQSEKLYARARDISESLLPSVRAAEGEGGNASAWADALISSI
jgi:hypothetical protein